MLKRASENSDLLTQGSANSLIAGALCALRARFAEKRLNTQHIHFNGRAFSLTRALCWESWSTHRENVNYSKKNWIYLCNFFRTFGPMWVRWDEAGAWQRPAMAGLGRSHEGLNLSWRWQQTYCAFHRSFARWRILSTWGETLHWSWNSYNSLSL